MMIAPSTSTPTLMMTQTVNAEPASSMMVHGSIRPTRSAMQRMTSSIVCNSTTTKVNLDLKLQGELKLVSKIIYLIDQSVVPKYEKIAKKS